MRYQTSYIFKYIPLTYFFIGPAGAVENTEYFSLPDYPENRSSSSDYQSDNNNDLNPDSGMYSLPASSSNSSHGTSPPRRGNYHKNPAPLPPRQINSRYNTYYRFELN